MEGGTTSFDWQARYDGGDTPWDVGGPHPELSQRLSSGDLAPPHDGARVLVPGAGHGHDAVALARRGWRVTAIEFVDGVADAARPELEKRGGALLVGDVFEVTLGGPFDLVWDHTFFCAINPERRAEWGMRVREHVPAGGVYVALVFPAGKPADTGGPPFGMDAAAVAAALGEPFVLQFDRPVARPVKRRTWPERIARFRRAGIRCRTTSSHEAVTSRRAGR